MNVQNLVDDEMNPGEQQSGIGETLPSLNSSQVSETVSSLASELDSGQRGGLVGSMLSGLRSHGVDLHSLLGKLGINQEVAANPEQATPEEAAALAAHAHETHPGIVQSAMSVYEQHPTLIKTIGLFAAAAIASQVNKKNDA